MKPLCCFEVYLEQIRKIVPFNDAVRFYLHVPLTERLTKTRVYRAECPWCGNGTLEVNPLKKVMWCRDCKRGGDLLLAVAKSEDETLIEAAFRLVKKYSIDLEHCNECRSPSSSG